MLQVKVHHFSLPDLAYNKITIEAEPPANSTIAEVAEDIIKLLDPERCLRGPHVVICWDESHDLVEPVLNMRWTRFSELQRALRTIKDLSFISVFLSTNGKFHHFSPSPEYDPSMRVMSGEYRMLPPITEVSFDQFAEVDWVKEKWSLQRVASTYQIVHLGRAL